MILKIRIFTALLVWSYRFCFVRYTSNKGWAIAAFVILKTCFKLEHQQRRNLFINKGI